MRIIKLWAAAPGLSLQRTTPQSQTLVHVVTPFPPGKFLGRKRLKSRIEMSLNTLPIQKAFDGTQRMGYHSAPATLRLEVATE
jgi:hypothetical protein